MIVKFETEKGCKMFDGFKSVEWTYDVECPDKDINVVDLPYNVTKTTNYQYINDCQSPDEMSGILANRRVINEEEYSKVSVDEIFANPDMSNARRTLLHCFGRDNTLKLFYTEFPAYVMNDSGKTVERV